MKTFKVVLEKTIIVRAEDERSAEIETRNSEGKEDPDVMIAQEITRLSEVPEDWREALPYGDDEETYLDEFLENDVD